MTSAFEVYQKKWDQRRNTQPKAWDVFRKELYSIFQNFSAEEYMFFVSDYPEVLSSFLKRNRYGNIHFKHKSLIFSKNSRKDFLFHLLSNESLQGYLQQGDLDALFFKEYADVHAKDISSKELEFLLNISQRSVIIPKGVARLGYKEPNRVIPRASIVDSSSGGSYYYEQEHTLSALKYAVTQVPQHRLGGRTAFL